METLINENGAVIIMIRKWLPSDEANNLCNYLATSIQWGHNGYTTNDTGRRIFSLVEGQTNNKDPSYKDSHDMKDYPCILRLKERIEKESGAKFNFCLLNEYRDGSCSIGYHADKEVIGSSNPAVV